MSSTQEPRWGAISQAAVEWNKPASTVRRWAERGLIPGRKPGRNWVVDLDALERTPEPARPSRWLTEADKQLAREVAAALLPLADWQKDKLALLLRPGRDRRGAA
jgi:hypothetical protein